jgi:hypothetical protein
VQVRRNHGDRFQGGEEPEDETFPTMIVVVNKKRGNIVHFRAKADEKG